VPWDPKHVFYVWFDALLNYFTALSFGAGDGDRTNELWPADYHVMAKDILKFHAVIWPAMLMAAGEEVPRRLFIHGYLTMKDASGEDVKMSKSLGNVLDPFEVMDKFGTDALRYYCFREVSFGQDGAVSTAGFESRYETELANDYGNLASRTIAMIARYREGTVPAAEPDAQLAQDFDGIAEEVSELLGRAEITQALDRIWQRVRRLNRYVEEQAPWKLAKDPEESGRLDTVLLSLAEGLRVVTVLLHPYIPQTTERLMEALGQDDVSIAAAAFGATAAGATVTPLDPPLFPKQ